MKRNITGLTFLISLFLACSVYGAGTIPRHDLSVSFDMSENLIRGVSHITLPGDKEIRIYTHDLTVSSVTLNGSPLKGAAVGRFISTDGKGSLEITFEGIFRGIQEEGGLENAGIASGNVISDKGIFLTGGWYPSIEGKAFYRLKALLPEGYSAISEADAITEKDTPYGREYSFDFPYPVREINFIAGKYNIVKDTFRGIDIYGYFFPQDASLAETYIKHTKKYIGSYENLLTPYPFKRFSIVENFLPTGYSMPTFTLLGREVVRLPFIVETSLGHEILHQWFGNYVYVDYDKGNWVEGLTTYLSDHLYEEQEGSGWKYRKKILTDYESYVSPGKEFPLRAFTSRVDFASRTIGYGKGAMVFHMLKNIAGETAFYEALKDLVRARALHEASWEDIKTVFEKQTGKDLAWFFGQWLDRRGVISITMKDPKVVFSGGANKVSFDIVQNGQPYIFNLPVRLRSDSGESVELLHIEKQEETFEITAEYDPVEIVLDEDYDLMRELPEAEYPPVVSRLLGDEKRLIVVPEKDRERYESLVAVFQGEGFVLKEEGEVKNEDIISSSLLILGFDGPLVKRLFGSLQRPRQGFTFMVRENPLNTNKVIALAHGDSQQEVDSVSGKIHHYGKYSFLRFVGGMNVEKTTDLSDRGIRAVLYEPLTVIRIEKTDKLRDITGLIADVPVIYVGERHTNYEDHKVQLEVIMSLHKQGRRFAIGMEMFQRPFQHVLDGYIAGTIDEKEFLKDTEYFERWKFDYNLYKEIIEFAKAENIPVIALNLRSEIIDTVSKGGIDALTEEEKKELPEDMDMTDEDYRERLRKIFLQHEQSGSRDFGNFVQSQILWDETMAHTINQYLGDNPGSQIVVLAGTGHIVYDSGIPQRVFRLNKKEYVTLVPYAAGLDDSVGTYVFFAEPQSPPPSMKIGVVLAKKDGRVQVERISHGSVAEEIGLKEGDILLSMDGWEIGDIADARIFMVGKKEGDTVQIRISRKKFLFGEKEYEFTATLR